MQADVVAGTTRVFRHVTISELSEVAQKLLIFSGNLRVCSLVGEMGAGKTTLVKAIGHRLHVTDTMSSPTFAIVNEYALPDDQRMYHIDCYRLKSETEARDLGMEEYFYSGHFCFVEWAERIPALMPDEFVQVTLVPEDETHRIIEFSIHGRKEKDGL